METCQKRAEGRGVASMPHMNTRKGKMIVMSEAWYRWSATISANTNVCQCAAIRCITSITKSSSGGILRRNSVACCVSSACSGESDGELGAGATPTPRNDESIRASADCSRRWCALDRTRRGESDKCTTSNSRVPALALRLCFVPRAPSSPPEPCRLWWKRITSFTRPKNPRLLPSALSVARCQLNNVINYSWTV